MSGDRFNFDDTGETFCCFAVALFTVVLLIITYLFWPESEINESAEASKKRCQCPPCQSKRGILRTLSTRKWFKRTAIKFIFLIAWIFLFVLIFQLSKFEVTPPSFDPYLELSIDRDASKTEIRKAYKQLSLIHHPDRGGDEKKFIQIHKAYMTLTNEVALKHWQDYGNTDDPGAVKFGMALPKWILKKENTVIVVGVYAIVFVLMLPLVVGLWWSNSMKYSNTKTLLVTVHLFLGSFMDCRHVAMTHLIKLLSQSYEFSSQFNRAIACRPSDNVELPPLINQIPMFTVFKRSIVGAPYANKARALIYAHMERLDLPAKSLYVDKQYIISQCPRLLEEMINSLFLILSIKHNCQPKSKSNLLLTIENCMHLTPLLVQAVSPTAASTLFQLPHIGPSQMRQIVHAHRNANSPRLLARLSEEKRRVVLSSLSDDQYRDVVNVLAGMPSIEISCCCQVLFDDDQSIWPHSMVTATVRLTRRPLLTTTATTGATLTATLTSSDAPLHHRNRAAIVVDASTYLRNASKKNKASWYAAGDTSVADSTGAYYRGASTKTPECNGGAVLRGQDIDGAMLEEETTGGGEEEEDEVEGGEEVGAPPRRKKVTDVPAWYKVRPRGKGKGAKGVSKNARTGKKFVGKMSQSKRPLEAADSVDDVVGEEDLDAPPLACAHADAASAGLPEDDVCDKPPSTSHDGDDDDDAGGDDNEQRSRRPLDQAASVSVPALSTLPTKPLMEAEAQKRELRRVFDPRARCNHPVHCPFFPGEKHEGWWVYLVNKKLGHLITKPVYIDSLDTDEEMDLKFLAPPFPGNYVYTLCVRSDSYVDMDFFENVPFTVTIPPEHVLQKLKEAENFTLRGSSSDDGEDDENEDDIDVVELSQEEDEVESSLE